MFRCRATTGRSWATRTWCPERRRAGPARAHSPGAGSRRSSAGRLAQLRSDQKALIERGLQGEARAPPRNHIHGPMRMRPAVELLAIHPKLAARDLAHFLVHGAQLELADLKAHGRAAVAAASRLMEHDGPILRLQL